MYALNSALVFTIRNLTISRQGSPRLVPLDWIVLPSTFRPFVQTKMILDKEHNDR